jgi:hypothetical protein
MNRRSQLTIILCTVALITAIVSHGIIMWLRIQTSFGNYWKIDQRDNKYTAFMAGSSLAGDGISWVHVSDVLNMRIEGWGVAGSSPTEWEYFQRKSSNKELAFIVVSPYDLNEYYLCDFRAEVVPLVQAIADLWHSKADWPFCKYVLSQYPLAYIRKLFPTAGRSDGVMVGLRERLRYIVKELYPMQAESGPTLSLNGKDSTPEYKKERISEWDEGRKLRRLAGLRSASLNRHAFNGPKRMAFQRMLSHAKEGGHVVVVVLPVSPAYAREFLTPEVSREYEEALIEMQHTASLQTWIRLDKIIQLNSNEYFWDLVHINIYGQKIATAALLEEMK